MTRSAKGLCACLQKYKSILNGARAQHTQAVQDRIDSVEQMKDVVDVTKGLFLLSKVSLTQLTRSNPLTPSQETAELEADAFVQRQKIAVAAEVKSMLDSWVRYEQQLKENEQAELARSVIDKVTRSLSEKKTQDEILASAIAEVERACCD